MTRAVSRKIANNASMRAVCTPAIDVERDSHPPRAAAQPSIKHRAQRRFFLLLFSLSIHLPVFFFPPSLSFSPSRPPPSFSLSSRSVFLVSTGNISCGEINSTPRRIITAMRPRYVTDAKEASLRQRIITAREHAARTHNGCQTICQRDRRIGGRDGAFNP